METAHHCLMFQRWMTEKGADPSIIEEALLWSAMPDLIQVRIGGEYRGDTHFECEETRGSQLHAMKKDELESVLFDHPCDLYLLDGLEDLTTNQRIGIYFHLIQDTQYDDWLSRYIQQEKVESSKSEQEHSDPSDLNAALKSDFRYFRADDGRELDPSDVAFTKRWSWGQSYRHELSLYGVDTDTLLADDPHPILIDLWKRMKADPSWHDGYEDMMREFWGYSIAQEKLPDAMADLEEKMLEDLVEHAFEDWKDLVR